MLEANKSSWFDKIFSIYNRNLLHRRFNSLQVSNLSELSERDKQKPLIIYANHSSWWDGLIAYQISKKLDLDFFVMMEEKQLRNLRLFLKLGAFSVVRENPRKAVESINYAVNLLQTNPANKAVWIFPQGEILHNDQRPVHFFQGLSRIIEKTGNCAAVPIVFRLEFLGNFKPEIFVSIGKLEYFKAENKINPKELTLSFAANTENLLDELKSKISNKKTDDIPNFQNIL